MTLEADKHVSNRIHFIGICGTAMATVAAMLKARGWDVRGSDQSVYPPMSTFLREQGIAPLDGYRAEHITPDLGLVCVGNAISRGNPELEAVLDRKIRVLLAARAGARAVPVVGALDRGRRHARQDDDDVDRRLAAHRGGRDPSVLVGGIAANFGGGYRLGGGREFVIEGDEYDSAFFDKTAKFLKYLPDIAIVNNIEFDHADIYPDVAAVELAFKRLAVLVPRNGVLLLGSDSPRAAALAAHAASPVETFGVERRSDLEGHRSRGRSRRHALQGAPAGDAARHLRGAAARRAQRPQRAGRRRGLRRRWASTPRRSARG